MKALQPENRQPVYALDASPDARLLAIGQQSDARGRASLTLWDLQSFALASEVETGPMRMLLSARFSPDGSTLAYVREDERVRYYNLRKGESDLLPSREGGIHTVSYAFSANRFAASGAGVEVWDAAALDIVWELPAPPAGGAQQKRRLLAAPDADGLRVAVAGYEAGEVTVYDLARDEVALRLPGAFEQGALALGFDPSGRFLAAVEANAKGLALWDVSKASPHLPHIFNEKARDYCSMAFHPGGDYMALGMLGGYVLVARLDDGAFVYEEPAHTGRVWDLAFTRDGRRLITGGDDGVVRIHELTSAAP